MNDAGFLFLFLFKGLYFQDDEGRPTAEMDALCVSVSHGKRLDLTPVRATASALEGLSLERETLFSWGHDDARVEDPAPQ